MKQARLIDLNRCYLDNLNSVLNESQQHVFDVSNFGNDILGGVEYHSLSKKHIQLTEHDSPEYFYICPVICNIKARLN